ncbi:transposase [Companilactobacillus crustorum]|uniref:transposase n=1 Tax=Companilactobacillus crustorum TaxID=392416 RepID=UPI000ECA5B87|nr:transposase [Companilactobacillus crustorum]WDT66154.1 transposase [Companilactobacillus crustorum]HCD08396.1 transposase [Lactobacillus sp.]
MLTPEKLHQDVKEYNDESFKLIEKNPWLIPTSVALLTFPIAVSIHGFWKNAILKKKLKIEREKTKQLKLENKLH